MIFSSKPAASIFEEMKIFNMNSRIKYIYGLIIISVIGLILMQFFWLYKDYNYYSSQPLFSTQYRFFMPRVATRVSAMAPVISNTESVPSLSLKEFKKLNETPKEVNSIIAYPENLQPAPAIWQKTNKDNIPGVAATLGTPLEVADELSVLQPSSNTWHRTSSPISGLVPTVAMPLQSTNELSVTALRTTMPGKLVQAIPAQLYSAIPYKAPSSYIVDKMKWQFGGSMLLIVITTSCLALMLKTIYKQRKISLMKNDFINNMTHELKTPLATVAVAVEAMRNYGVLEDSDKTNLYLNISKNEIDHLSNLVEMILQQSVFDIEKMYLNKKLVNIDRLIEELIQNIQLSNKDFEILFNTEGTVLDVYLDPVHLINTIRNLIDNAIKYSLDHKKVIITSSYHKESWQLQVTDFGVGIPKVYHKEVFEKFFRVPNYQMASIKGFGLGLAYVKQIVELHKGSITLKSNNTGSTFTITIGLKN